jgi:hypothetical protein
MKNELSLLVIKKVLTTVYHYKNKVSTHLYCNINLANCQKNVELVGYIGFRL